MTYFVALRKDLKRSTPLLTPMASSSLSWMLLQRHFKRLWVARLHPVGMDSRSRDDPPVGVWRLEHVRTV